MTSKGGDKQIVGYKYYLGQHLGFCYGPVDTLNELRCDERSAWTGSASSGTITIRADELFGGDDREGGVSGPVQLQQGDLSQLQNAYLLEKIGPDIPAFRGLFALVYVHCYLGNNPYLKPWSAVISRIHVRQTTGLPQWYDAKAAIPTPGSGNLYPNQIVTLSLIGIKGYAFSVDGKWMIAWNGGHLNWVDVATRTNLGQHGGGGPFSGFIGNVAIAIDGTAYYAGWGISTGASSLYTTPPLGATSHEVAPGAEIIAPRVRVFDPETTAREIYITGGTGGGYCVKDGLGIRGVADPMTGVDFCLHANGDRWALMEEIDGSNFELRNLTDGTTVFPVTGLGSHSGVSDAFFCYVESASHFYVAIDGHWYLIDETDGHIKDSGSRSVSGFGDESMKAGYLQQSPGTYNSFWMQFTEVSLVTGATLQTVNSGNWSGFHSPLQVYDPFNDAIIASGSSQINYHFFGSSGLDMNPSHIIRECLTDPDWGMGYLEDDIDDASFMAAANTLYNEGLGISLLWDGQTELENFVTEIIRHIDGALYVSRTTGKFVLKLIRKDYVASALPLFDESNIKSMSNPSRQQMAELVNSVTATFWDRGTFKDDSVSVLDPAMVQMQGSVIDAKVDYPGFTSKRNATIAAQRDLKSLSSPLLSCTMIVGEDGKDLNIGDPVRLSWGKWLLEEQVMRVVGLAFSDGTSNQVRVSLTEDVFDQPTVAVVGETGSGWVDPSGPPKALEHQMAFEVPYYEIVQSQGQATVDDRLNTEPEAGIVGAAAARVEPDIAARIWVDSGAGYESAAYLDFAPYATLLASVSKTDTSFTIENGIDLDSVEVGSTAWIGDEIVRVDAIGTSTVTVGRGCHDTVPQDHEAGAEIFFWSEFFGADPTIYVSGETVSVKIAPQSGQGVLDLVWAPPLPVTLEQRAYRPYPPGKFQINGVYYPPGPFDDTMTFTWAHRDRTQQTGSIVYDYTEGDIGPEPGVTYQFTAFVNNVQVFDTNVGGLTTLDWLPDYAGLVRVEVRSIRDGLPSLQAATHEFNFIGQTNLRVTESDEDRVTEIGDSRVLEN